MTTHLFFPLLLVMIRLLTGLRQRHLDLPIVEPHFPVCEKQFVCEMKIWFYEKIQVQTTFHLLIVVPLPFLPGVNRFISVANSQLLSDIPSIIISSYFSVNKCLPLSTVAFFDYPIWFSLKT